MEVLLLALILIVLVLSTNAFWRFASVILILVATVVGFQSIADSWFFQTREVMYLVAALIGLAVYGMFVRASANKKRQKAQEEAQQQALQLQEQARQLQEQRYREFV